MKWVLPLLLFCLLFVFCVHTLTDINQDIGFHLTVGKIIWQEHTIPNTNFFSYTNPDFEFINQHWLAKVFFYLISTIAGLKGLIVFKALILTGAFVLSFLAFLKKESISISVITGLLSIFILIDRSLVRPEIFSFLYLGYYLFILFRKLDSKLIWSLPLVQLIWVNTHIYFFLGPLIYLFFIVEIFIRKREILMLWNKRLIWVGIAIALVNFINPFGWKGALYPLFVFKNYGLPILENLSPFEVLNFSYPVLSIYAFFIAIAFTSVGFIVNRKNIKNNIFEVGLIISSSILGLMMLRNMAIFGLIMVPVTVKNFYEGRIYWNNKLFQGLLIILLLILTILVVNNDLQGGVNRQFGLIIPDWGQKAIDFVKANDISGPVFNNVNTGSFLIWKVPEQKVFIDTRTEAYPAEFVKNIFIPMQSEPEKWELYSEKYNINYIFYAYREATPWSQKFLKDISQNKKWTLVYLDENIVIFIKNLPQNEEVIKKHKIDAEYK